MKIRVKGNLSRNREGTNRRHGEHATDEWAVGKQHKMYDLGPLKMLACNKGNYYGEWAPQQSVYIITEGNDE